MSNNKNDEFSLESIIAEFGGKNSPVPKETAEPVIPAAKKPEPKPTPKAEPKPAPKPEPKTESASKSPESFEENKTERFSEIRKNPVNSRPVPSSEDLKVAGAEEEQDNIIDLGAYDDAYRKRAHSIRNMRRQLKANSKAIKKLNSGKLKKRNINAVVPATLNSKKKLPVPKSLSKKVLRQPKVEPRQMLRKLDRELRSLTVRSVLATVFCLPLVYMTVAAYLKLPLPEFMSYASHPVTFTIITMAILAAVIITAYDIYFGGCYALLTMRANADSLIFASSLASIGHCIVSIVDKSTMYGNESAPVLAPVCVLPALGLLFSLYGDRIRVRTYRSSLIKTHRLTSATTVAPLRDKFDGDVVYASATSRDLSGFFNSFFEKDAVTRMMHWFAPALIAVSVLLAVYASVSGSGSTPFFWNWSVIISFTPALGFFLSYVLPHARLTKRLARDGVNTGGIDACGKIATRSFVMLRDRDLFPAESVTIKAVRTSEDGNYPLALTASLLSSAQTVLAEPFLEQVRKHCIPLLPVTDITIGDNGGYTGIHEGHKVMVGTCSFIQRCGIKTPEDIKLRTAICCAVDSKLLAVYAMNYEVASSNDYTVSLLDRNGYFPILATRDVNITSAMIQDRFGIPSTEVVYPKAGIRAVMSNSANTLDAKAIVTLKPSGSTLAQTLVGCHRARSASRVGLIFSLISSLVGLGFGAIMAYFGWYEAATPVNMLLYYLIWVVPMLIFAGWVNRY